MYCSEVRSRRYLEEAPSGSFIAPVADAPVEAECSDTGWAQLVNASETASAATPLTNRIHVLPRYLKKSTAAFANSEYASLKCDLAPPRPSLSREMRGAPRTSRPF